MPNGHNFDEVWTEVNRIRERLHDWASSISRIEFMEQRMTKMEQAIQNFSESSADLKVMQARFDDFTRQMKEEQSRTRWMIGVMVTIAVAVASIVSRSM